MKNLENNKLIAEFMGAKINFPMNGLEEEATFEKLMFGEDYLGFQLRFLEFNSNWEWLMPVVEKIETMEYSVIISCGNCEIFNCSKGKTVFFAESHSKIEATYEAVVMFIKTQIELK